MVIKTMEKNNSLKDYAFMCECSDKVASFGILADFIKRAVMDYYSYKSTGAVMPDEEKEVFLKKYNEIRNFLANVIHPDISATREDLS